MPLRLLFVAMLATLAIVTPYAATAQAPGHVPKASVLLRAAAGVPQGVEVVIRWTGTDNPAANYQVWRRTPWDLSWQEAARYADVPASARLSDGSYEFVDPDPFGLPARPCYMVGATLGDPPQSFALPGCIPTLPSAMAELAVSARPGPDPNTWYVSGSGFAPGARITLQELTCAAAPCDGPPLSVDRQIEATIDGRFAAFTALPAGMTTGTRTVVAYEPGWLPSQFPNAPTVQVLAAHPGAAIGHPLSIRTGDAAVDRVIAALESQDAAGIAALFVPRELAAPSDGRAVVAMPIVTCGNGDTIAVPAEDGYERIAREFLGQRIYAVFRIAPTPGQWTAFDGATDVIVLAGAPFRGSPRGSMVAINLEGVVGAGPACGAPPTYYLRNVQEYLLPPLTQPNPPTPPTTGNGAEPQAQNDHRGSGRVALFGVLALILAAGTFWLERGTRSTRH